MLTFEGLTEHSKEFLLVLVLRGLHKCFHAPSSLPSRFQDLRSALIQPKWRVFLLLTHDGAKKKKKKKKKNRTRRKGERGNVCARFGLLSFPTTLSSLGKRNCTWPCSSRLTSFHYTGVEKRTQTGFPRQQVHLLPKKRNKPHPLFFWRAQCRAHFLFGKAANGRSPLFCVGFVCGGGRWPIFCAFLACGKIAMSAFLWHELDQIEGVVPFLFWTVCPRPLTHATLFLFVLFCCFFFLPSFFPSFLPCFFFLFQQSDFFFFFAQWLSLTCSFSTATLKTSNLFYLLPPLFFFSKPTNKNQHHG